MNVSELRPPLRRFRGPAGSRAGQGGHRARRPAAAAAQRAAGPCGGPPSGPVSLAVGTAVAAAAGCRLRPARLSHRPARGFSGTKHRGRPVHIRTAAFTVDATLDGTVHVTWDKSQYIQDRQDSAVAASPARGRVPRADQGRRLLQGAARQRTAGPGRGRGRGRPGHDGRDGSQTAPSSSPSRPRRCPPGDELFIGYLSPSQLAVTHGQPAIRRAPGARRACPPTCTSRRRSRAVARSAGTSPVSGHSAAARSGE